MGARPNMQKAGSIFPDSQELRSRTKHRAPRKIPVRLQSRSFDCQLQLRNRLAFLLSSVPWFSGGFCLRGWIYFTARGILKLSLSSSLGSQLSFQAQADKA